MEVFLEGGVFQHESRNGVAVLITAGSEMGGEYWGASYRIQTGQEQLRSGLQPKIHLRTYELSFFGYTCDHGVGQTSEGTSPFCKATLQRTLVKCTSDFKRRIDLGAQQVENHMHIPSLCL